MIRIPIVINQCEHRIGVSQKNGKQYDFWDCWFSVEGYAIPWHDSVFTNSLNGIDLEVGMTGFAVIDQDRYMKPRLSYRF